MEHGVLRTWFKKVEIFQDLPEPPGFSHSNLRGPGDTLAIDSTVLTEYSISPLLGSPSGETSRRAKLTQLSIPRLTVHGPEWPY